MTITELINKLSQLRDKYGDLECAQQSGEDDERGNAARRLV